MKYLATGIHRDGSEVAASVTDLSGFINASPDSSVLVDCDGVYHQVAKGDVEWKGTQAVPDSSVLVDCDGVYHQVAKGDVEWKGIQAVQALNY